MSTTVYYKRYRMEAPLAGLPAVPMLPFGFDWVPWEEFWLETFAEVKARAFHGELDSHVFPNLAHYDGCLTLMQAIRGKPGFCPSATWLVSAPDGFCGTVQGLHDGETGTGSIQNLGVVSDYRRQGIGEALMLKAMHGFRRAGLRRATLEVTARNTGALRLYHSLGFNTVKTLYREVETPREELFVI